MGIVRGLGTQAKASIMSFIGYWIIGLPLAYYLVMLNTSKLMGVWIGMLSANSFNFFGQLTLLLLFTNWQKQADKA
jgi:MATE family multidrug resistance protein